MVCNYFNILGAIDHEFGFNQCSQYSFVEQLVMQSDYVWVSCLNIVFAITMN